MQFKPRRLFSHPILTAKNKEWILLEFILGAMYHFQIDNKSQRIKIIVVFV